MNTTLPAGALASQHADLDQAVCVEGGVHFLAHAIGQAVGADVHNGVQMVRLCALFSALGRGKFNLGHGRIIRALRTSSKSPLGRADGMVSSENPGS